MVRSKDVQEHGAGKVHCAPHRHRCSRSRLHSWLVGNPQLLQVSRKTPPEQSAADTGICLCCHRCGGCGRLIPLPCRQRHQWSRGWRPGGHRCGWWRWGGEPAGGWRQRGSWHQHFHWWRRWFQWHSREQHRRWWALWWWCRRRHWSDPRQPGGRQRCLQAGVGAGQRVHRRQAHTWHTSSCHSCSNTHSRPSSYPYPYPHP
jgi:hypothetical protein